MSATESLHVRAGQLLGLLGETADALRLSSGQLDDCLTNTYRDAPDTLAACAHVTRATVLHTVANLLDAQAQAGELDGVALALREIEADKVLAQAVKRGDIPPDAVE